MPTPLSPLRYPGGKQALAPLLAQIVVANDLHDGTFVEPFAGGAGASLQLMVSEFVSSVVLNDADRRVFAFWRAALNQTEALVERIAEADISIKTWHRCRAVYDAPSRHSQMELAFSVFFLNRCNRSGILSGGGPIGGYKQNGNWKLDARFNRDELISRIRRIAEYRDRIEVRREDALELLKALPKVSGREPIVYLDPPYYKKGQRLYLNAMEHQDHVALAAFLHSSPPFRWILTYDNVAAIRGLYRDMKRHQFTLSYSAYERRTGKELLIVDPRISVSREILKGCSRHGRLQFTA
jgi:DNA adenine methylase